MLRLLTILLALCLWNGCAFLDEIDKIGGGEDEVADDQSGESCAQGSQSEACTNTPVNWWANAKTLSSDEMKTDIVSCRVGDATQFMSRKSCFARGGMPGS